MLSKEDKVNAVLAMEGNILTLQQDGVFQLKGKWVNA